MGKTITTSTKLCNHNYNNSSNKNNNNNNNNNNTKGDEVMYYKKGAWTPEEDNKLLDYVRKNNGHPGNWKTLPKLAGILRCGKSCRLRWTNYLRPDINRGPFSKEEHNTVVQLHGLIGNRWAAIAARLPGRTDNDVKNYYNSHLKKHKTIKIEPGIIQSDSHITRHTVQWESIRLETEARLSSSLHNSPSDSGYLKLNSDHFLCLWNTEVGESFRKIGNEKASKIEWPSSSLEAFSWVMSQVGQPISVKNEVQQNTYSDSAELSDPSDTAMNMLLDSPITE